MGKVLITTVPFGDRNDLPFELLRNENIEYLVNPFKKKLTEDQIANMVMDFDVIIAGTEPITEKVINEASHLRLISRVGVGLDSIDLIAARKRGIKVSYTPDAPTPAVAELTIGLMLTLLRFVHVSNSQMHQGQWHRYFGRRLEEVTVGIIGMGRVGRGVLKRLKGFDTSKILVNDINPSIELDSEFNLEWANKEKIYKEADIVSLHLPLTGQTKNLIRKKHLLMFKHDSILINTSRGGIINEDPEFCSPEDLTYNLKESSICQTASDSSGLIGAYELPCGALMVDQPQIEPNGFAILSNYPNPFNPTTHIVYTLTDHGEYTLKIYDINGKLIRDLISGFGVPGQYKVIWDSSDDNGQKMASGIYFYHLSTISNITKNKMILVK